ncbi:MAG: endopeptidase La [Anaerolineaceae bacterium]|nr:endopeptidase La [Anaerolineaceae bacterium]
MGSDEFELIPNATPDADGLIECAVIPLRGTVIYPQAVNPVTIATAEALAVAQSALTGQKTVIGLVQRDPTSFSGTPDDLFLVGTELALGGMLRMPDDTRTALAQGRRRVRVVAFVQTTPFIIARAEVLEDIPAPPEAVQSAMQLVTTTFRQVANLNPNMANDLVLHVLNIEDPGRLADMVAATLGLPLQERQRLLETLSVHDRLHRVSVLLHQELNMLELKDDISSQVQQEIDRSQREVYLREQMRVIQTELGETDIFQQEIDEVHQQIMAADLPDEVYDKAMKELGRLAMMPPMSPEGGVIRTYIDWLTDIPWQETTKDRLDVIRARRILDQDHYGLQKVKDRILEYIAVRKLAGNKMKTPILCFVGPPGVGKTSLGRSIARALERNFVRVSLGGVRDEAEIRGHRRTYVGAMPGRIIQTMRRAGTINPVFILDEIDKLGADFRGDPAAALLEAFDPEQNTAFFDHYLDVPYDLSQILFITTANDLYPLPPALLDRLEVIEFPGYIEEEKLAIARKFLIPRQMESHGLGAIKLTFDVRALRVLVRDYTYEAGVRNLEREIANVCRKIARMVAEGKTPPRRITPSILTELLGPPLYGFQLTNKQDAIGVVTGLVWTYDGGDISLIEVSVLPGKGALLLTGQLGDVMQESAQTAMSYMRSRAADFDVPHEDFENYDVHIHLPEGAVPKDGPSAGITLATALISAFSERPVRSDFAMTGEITLRGRVLPVGAVKEKVLAARRAGIKNVILPRPNKNDLVDVPPEALKDLNIIFVDDMQQVCNRVLLPAPVERQRDQERQENGEQEQEQPEGES